MNYRKFRHEAYLLFCEKENYNHQRNKRSLAHFLQNCVCLFFFGSRVHMSCQSWAITLERFFITHENGKWKRAQSICGGRLNIIWKAAIKSKTKLNAEWKSKCNNNNYNKRRTQKQDLQETWRVNELGEESQRTKEMKDIKKGLSKLKSKNKARIVVNEYYMEIVYKQ